MLILAHLGYGSKLSTTLVRTCGDLSKTDILTVQHRGLSDFHLLVYTMSRIIFEKIPPIDLNYRSHKHHMETPLMAAIIHENYLVVEYLLHAGVDTTLNARHGRTPMHAAAELGFADILELLIEHGVGDVNERHDDGYRPLHRAVLGQ